jgi:tetratricopeptide (TPR) repeat protein
MVCPVLLAIVAVLGSAPPRAGSESLEARRLVYQCSALTKEPAIGACRKALELGLTPDHAATVHSLLALHLSALDRWDEVVASYRELVRLRPDDAQAHWRLGDALLYGLDQPKEALSPLRDAVRLDSGLAAAYVSLGVALAELGARPEAIEALAAAQRLEPRCFDARPSARRIFETLRRGEQ